MVESCLVILVVCLLFAGMVELARVLAAREILHHAAARGARARTVGFNWWMVEKAIRVAAIPNAGRMLEPTPPAGARPLTAWIETFTPGVVWDRALAETPDSTLSSLELARIPEYLAAENHLRAEYVLDYEDWDTIHGMHPDMPVMEDGSVLFRPVIEVTVRQQYPFLESLPHRAFYARDSVLIEGTSALENHYPFYLDDENR